MENNKSISPGHESRKPKQLCHERVVSTLGTYVKGLTIMQSGEGDNSVSMPAAVSQTVITYL